VSSLEIRLPALSATMEEATVLAWLVKPGDTVTEGQPIAEVSTDKVDMELESPYAGTIQALLAQQGDTVPLGAPMATIESEADDLLSGLSLAAATEAAAESPEVGRQRRSRRPNGSRPPHRRARSCPPPQPPGTWPGRRASIWPRSPPPAPAAR
jgi:pyruvate/2-oxoglutarate dehydrogenase complex dihydrolipoamide acyltransferase (E2) component